MKDFAGMPDHRADGSGELVARDEYLVSLIESLPSAPHAVCERECSELVQKFTYHSPKGNQAERYSAIRNACLHLSVVVTALAPPSKERDRSIECIEMASMQANAAIARHETDIPDELPAIKAATEEDEDCL